MANRMWVISTIAAALLFSHQASGEEYLPMKEQCGALYAKSAGGPRVDWPCKVGAVVTRLRITSFRDAKKERAAAKDIINSYEACDRVHRIDYDRTDAARALRCFLRDVGWNWRARERYERELALFGWTVPESPRR